MTAKATKKRAAPATSDAAQVELRPARRLRSARTPEPAAPPAAPVTPSPKKARAAAKSAPPSPEQDGKCRCASARRVVRMPAIAPRLSRAHRGNRRHPALGT